LDPLHQAGTNLFQFIIRLELFIVVVDYRVDFHAQKVKALAKPSTQAVLVVL